MKARLRGVLFVIIVAEVVPKVGQQFGPVLASLLPVAVPKVAVEVVQTVWAVVRVVLAPVVEFQNQLKQ